MKKCLSVVLILLIGFLILPLNSIADITDDITDKIIIKTEEVLLYESEYKRSSFFYLRIYNNDNVAYKLKSLSCQFSTDDKVKIKDFYEYYLKEYDTEGRFPHTFEIHLVAVLSCLTPVTYVMFWSALHDSGESQFDLFIKQPVKSIVVIPSNIEYKIKEGLRNKKIRKELKKYYSMNDIIKYKEMKGTIIEPDTELLIPLATRESFIILENVETKKEYRFSDGKIYYLNSN